MALWIASILQEKPLDGAASRPLWESFWSGSKSISVNFIAYSLRHFAGTLNESRSYGDSNPDLLEGQKGLLVFLQPFWPFGYFGHIWNFLVLFFRKSFDCVVSQATRASALCTCNETWGKCGENGWQEIVRTWDFRCKNPPFISDRKYLEH